MSAHASPAGTAARLRHLCRLRPRLGLVLGSGFQSVVKEVLQIIRIPYEKLPGFPVARVPGHAGELVVGHLAGTPVLVLSGRSHFYEGHSMEQVTFAVRTLAAFGVADLVLTNAAGGINRRFRPGDFMLVTDHINFMGVNPLRGPVIAGLQQFVDLSKAYDPALSKSLTRAAEQSKLKLRTGVYMAVSGPTYETPAEVRAYERLGADAVGMSTVPEVIAARQCGMRVAAISCITNVAAGLSKEPLSHAEVLETSKRVGAMASQLLKHFAKAYAKSP